MPKASHQDLRFAFRELLASGSCYHTASVFDPMSARIAADLGFEVGILGGSVASLQVLAAPDFALITLSEFVEQATRIGRVAQLPVLADADHGYGNALNVMRTVIELERAGVAALTIEDTLLPAQFGRKSTDLIPVEEGVGKIRAALEARVDSAMAIIARTNAGVLSTEEIIVRTQSYQKAGADGICMVGVKDFEQLEQIAEHLNVPLMLVTYGNPNLRDDERLARWACASWSTATPPTSPRSRPPTTACACSVASSTSRTASTPPSCRTPTPSRRTTSVGPRNT
jgi:carboxyvinyl-carboxyphosphonate phosphorylmutase